MRKIAIVFAALFTIIGSAFAQPEIGGFMYMHGFNDTRISGEDITTARLRMWGEEQIFSNLQIGLLTEVDVRRPGNELNQAFLYAKQGQSVGRIGRIFLSAGFAAPAPNFSPTAFYPRSPFTYNIYAYGVQGQLSGEKYFLMHDITGTSGESYDSSQSFSQIEYSYRIGRNFNNAVIAQAGQISDQFVRLSVDGSYQIKAASLFGAVYYSDEDYRSRSVSALGHVMYGLHKHVTPHAQIDVRQDGDTVYTVGTMLGDIMKASFFADYEFGGEKDGFVFRVQLRHDF